ncbi:MAG TPA: agmatine deiminase family protein [Myxococcota bacterium]|nr:agmatine deiminase family protein [Myxococcota bacterium]
MRWPAEWEPHRATWLAWPHAETTWPGHLAAARAEYAEIVRALQGRETVELLVRDAAMEEDARKQLSRAGVDPDRGLRFHHVPTNDSWLRDSGPVFVADDAGNRRALAFGFNAWGGKYPPWDLDDRIGAAVAGLARVPCEEVGFVLEGGSIDGDGAGAILTTESCLLNTNREVPPRTRDQMEQRLARWLGARRVIWLAGGIEADDTDGHIDDCARFVAPGVVVAARADSGGDEVMLAENRRRLVAAGFAVHDLPMPPVHRVGGEACPASYANFYLANGAALVPAFGAASDDRALAVLRDVLPGREVIGIPCPTLVLGLGAIHCLSQQEPA